MLSNRLRRGFPEATACSFTLWGVTHSRDTQKEVLAGVLRALAGRDPGFLERLPPAIPGWTRKFLSRRREEVRRGRRDGAPVRLPGGWWLRTDLMKENKMKILRLAAGVAGLTWGKDMIVRLD